MKVFRLSLTTSGLFRFRSLLQSGVRLPYPVQILLRQRSFQWITVRLPYCRYWWSLRVQLRSWLPLLYCLRHSFRSYRIRLPCIHQSLWLFRLRYTLLPVHLSRTWYKCCPYYPWNRKAVILPSDRKGFRPYPATSYRFRFRSLLQSEVRLPYPVQILLRQRSCRWITVRIPCYRY